MYDESMPCIEAAAARPQAKIGRRLQALAAAGLLALAGAAQAALVPYTANGVDLVFDDDYTPVDASQPGLTWLANANLAATEHFGVSGLNPKGTLTWAKALEWIAAMNAANYAGANNWRLWSALNSDGSTPNPCAGYFCTRGEFGHLFYTEGGLTPPNAINTSAILSSVFTNMQDAVYWSDTAFAPSPGDVWAFDASQGLQSNHDDILENYAWAVRPGQIAAAPLPGTVVLMALGLAGLGARHPRHRDQRRAGHRLRSRIHVRPTRRRPVAGHGSADRCRRSACASARWRDASGSPGSVGRDCTRAPRWRSYGDNHRMLPSAAARDRLASGAKRGDGQSRDGPVGPHSASRSSGTASKGATHTVSASRKRPISRQLPASRA